MFQKIGICGILSIELGRDRLKKIFVGYEERHRAKFSSYNGWIFR